nr:hypothetical protein [Macromonas nakdongensis]
MRLRAPEGARYVVQSIDRRNTARPRGRYIYLDARLRLLSTQDKADYPGQYDPRGRTWYRTALSRPGASLTSPYLFFSDRQVGITMAMQHPRYPGVVIGADIQLQTLSALLARQKVTPHSQLALVDGQGTVFAHEDTIRLVRLSVADPEKPELANLDNFGMEILATIAQTIDLTSVAPDRGLRTTLNTPADLWHVSVDALPLDVGTPLYLVMATPDGELLAQAHTQTRVAAWVTLLIVVLSVPITWLIAHRIAQPIMTLAQHALDISRFRFDRPIRLRTWILEVGTLAAAMTKLKSTVQRFLDLSGAIAAEHNFDRLLPRLLTETLSVVEAPAGVLYLYDGQGLRPACAQQYDGAPLTPEALARMPTLPLPTDTQGQLRPDPTSLGPALSQALQRACVVTMPLHADDIRVLRLPEALHREAALHVVAVPLLNRQRDLTGAMVLLAVEPSDEDRVTFIGALSGTAAVTLEAQALIRAQKDLFESFIRLVANAVDAKSAYTGGHCARVPELTHLLARATCAVQHGPYRHFHLNEDGWETLRIAAWLHDCGKVTTPEHVVDKATKLEAIYNRIHEVRMRFELLKTEAEVECLRRILEGGDRQAAEVELAQTWRSLDEDFAFVARCNQGGAKHSRRTTNSGWPGSHSAPGAAPWTTAWADRPRNCNAWAPPQPPPCPCGNPCWQTAPNTASSAPCTTACPPTTGGGSAWPCPNCCTTRANCTTCAWGEAPSPKKTATRSTNTSCRPKSC